MNEIIEKQLNVVPNLKKTQRVSYYEAKAGNQVHMDTMFWNESGVKDVKLIPILVIVDVATRFTKYYLQKTKNEKVLEHYEDFKKELTKRFPETNPNTVLITDDAKELALPFKNHANVKHKVSKSMNKAVMAEMKIAQIRKKLRAIELDLNVGNISDDTEVRITGEMLELILPELSEDINTNAKQQPEPKTLQCDPPFKLTTPVFLVNLHKFFPYQMKDVLRKKSYDMNWYMEPFRISDSVTTNGVTKYELTDYINADVLKFRVYQYQLQPINSKVAVEYITNWYRYNQNREGSDFF